MDMFRDIFNFSKKRTGLEALVFFLFYLGCFALISAFMDAGA